MNRRNDFFLHHFIFCILVLIPCTFSDGDVQGGTQEELGRTDNENNCASLVMEEREVATGATWNPGQGKCWAEFGARIVGSSAYRTCLFKSSNKYFITISNK